MMKMINDSKNSPIQIKQLTHNKLLKMFSIYLILKKRQKKKKQRQKINIKKIDIKIDTI